MERNLAKKKLLNYTALLFLVMLLAISLAACGSTPGDNSNNIITPPNNSGGSTSYEISGEGRTITPGDNFGISLKFVSATTSGGEFYFSDIQRRMEFKGTTIKSITLTSGTATVIAEAAFLEMNAAYIDGYTFNITIIDDDQDKFSIKINDPDGNEIYNLDPQPIDMINGNFTITIL